jgi:hypothetical protein
MALFSVLFLSETAFAAAMLASLIAAAKMIHSLSGSTPVRLTRASVIAFVTGVLVGVATYMRPTWLLVGPGLAVLVTLFCGAPLRTRLLASGCLCIGLGLSLLPWTYRNYRVTGHFIPTTLWVGPSLYDGLNPSATGDSDMEFFERDQLLQKMSEYEMDKTYRERAWTFAGQNPAKVVWLAFVKQSRYWSPAPNSEQFGDPRVKVVAWLVYLPLILCALAGAWFGRGDIWLLILTAAPILYFAALHLLFVGSLRYRLPAEYALTVLSAFGLIRWLRPTVSAT